MSKFTPGPWLSDKYGNICTDPNKSAHTRIVFSGLTLSGGPIAEANTRLASDAPALLDALEAMTEQYVSLVNCGDCGNWDPELDAAVKQARALIAKHRGGV